MIRTVIKFAAAASLATLAVALPGLASADTVTIAHKGTEYSYTVTETPQGRIIAGKTSAGVPFKLAVSKYTVDGHFNNNPVSFKLSEVKPIKGIVEVASR
jgi:hypothetical protein